jgi:probable rRNA maturation factor
MNLELDLQSASSEPAPDEDDIRRWMMAALKAGGRLDDCEISLRLVDEPEMAQLNSDYRGRKGPTNVLSFNSDLPVDLGVPLLGDIVICAPLVRREANEQGKSRTAHWAHLTVHGTLHLLGFDHLEDAEAETMEHLESQVMLALGFVCPYHAAPLLEQQGA